MLASGFALEWQQQVPMYTDDGAGKQESPPTSPLPYSRSLLFCELLGICCDVIIASLFRGLDGQRGFRGVSLCRVLDAQRGLYACDLPGHTYGWMESMGGLEDGSVGMGIRIAFSDKCVRWGVC